MYQKNNVMAAGISTETEFDALMAKPAGERGTGYTFIRINEECDAGNIVYLGIDYSLVRLGEGGPRDDLAGYYREHKEDCNNE